MFNDDVRGVKADWYTDGKRTNTNGARQRFKSTDHNKLRVGTKMLGETRAKSKLQVGHNEIGSN